MRTLLLISFIFLILGSQAALTTLPGGALESLRAYFRGVCAATSTDCDLSPLSSCYDDISAFSLLNTIYQSCVAVANADPENCHSILQSHLVEGINKNAASVSDLIRCEEKLPFARMLNDKLTTPDQGFGGWTANKIHYASARPVDTFITLKQMAALFEQGDFESVGLLDANLKVQAVTLKRKENLDWRKNAKNSRRSLLKGMCEALVIDCPMSTLNCMDEESSAADLHTLYEWARSVATKSMSAGAKEGAEFLLERGKEIIDRIPRASLECERKSPEVKLMNEKLGFDVWSEEWLQVVGAFMKEYPGFNWHSTVTEYQLFENNNIEGVGVVLALTWYEASEWKHGKLGRRMPSTSDL